MKKTSIIVIILFCSFFLLSIDLNLPCSAIQNATSGLNLIYSSPSSIAANPALQIDGFESSATYLFSMRELPLYNLHLAYSFGRFGFHLGESYLDHELYKENHFSLSTNYRWNSISAGIALRMLHNTVENYQEASSYLFDSGIHWNNGKFETALSIQNFSQSSFLDTKLPVSILWESCYQISELSRVTIGWEKEDDYNFSFKFAGRYDIFSVMTILASYQYEPDRIGAGTVFHINKINISYSVRTHQYIGLTHYVSVGYEF